MKIGITSRRRQSGQMLPIAAASFLVMCGLAGLAIDASRDYLVKRDAQNAADFATLAAARQMPMGTSLSPPPTPNSPPLHPPPSSPPTTAFTPPHPILSAP